MAEKQAVSMADILGARSKQIVEGVSKKPVVHTGNMKLPDGIENGVAQLVAAGFQKIASGANAGKPIFVARGIVKHPVTHNGLTVKGQGTIVTEHMYETPTKARKTVEAHLHWVRDFLVGMGVKAETLTDPSKYDAALKLLLSVKPHFSFRTWRGKKKLPGTAGYNPTYDGPNAPEPQVQEQWGGRVEFNESKEPSANGVLADESGPTDPSDQDFDDGSVAEEVVADEVTEVAGDGPVDESAEVTDYSEETDIDVLVGVAKDEPEDNHPAQDRLWQLAEEAGMDVDPNDSELAQTTEWEDFGQLIKDFGQVAEEPKEVENDCTVSYKPPAAVKHPKTKKPYPKAENWTVTALNKRSKVADLKHANGHVLKGVKVSELTVV